MRQNVEMSYSLSVNETAFGSQCVAIIWLYSLEANSNFWAFFFTDQVLKFMNEFECKKSSGVEIPPKVIKLAKEEIIVPIQSQTA